MNKRSVRSISNYGTLQHPLAQSQQIPSGAQGIYSRYIYPDLIKLRSKVHYPVHNVPTRNSGHNMTSTGLKVMGTYCVEDSQLSEKALHKINEIMTKREHTTSRPREVEKIDKGVQLSPIECKNDPTRASILLSDKKCSLAELLVSANKEKKGDKKRKEIIIAVETETCRHADNRYTIRDDNVCAKIGDGEHFIGSNSKQYRQMERTPEKEERVRTEIKNESACRVEEVLFGGEETGGDKSKEGGCIDIGTAEFKNPLDKDSDHKTVLKEKEAHIEILRKLLAKAMRIIKALRDQVGLLNAQNGKKGDKDQMKALGRLESVLAGDITEGNLDEIGNFMDALHNVTHTENERLLNKKVELLAEKYGDEAKSLAENLVKLTSRSIGGTNQFASPTRLQTKAGHMLSNGIDSSLSPIQTPGKSPNHMSVHNEIMDLYRQAEEEMEQKNAEQAKKGELQMTFQQEEDKQESDVEPEKNKGHSRSSSRSIRNWKTFVANVNEEEENSEEDVDAKKRRHNRSCAAAGRKGKKPNNGKKQKESTDETESNRSRKPKTDHRRLEESISMRSSHNHSIKDEVKKGVKPKGDNKENDSLDENLMHIESAMSNFLCGFKDLKSELSQIGEAMHSCSQIPVSK